MIVFLFFHQAPSPRPNKKESALARGHAHPRFRTRAQLRLAIFGFLQVSCVGAWQSPASSLKEVIQPHLPIRLPCYDFTPVIGHTVASAPLAVKLPASGATNSHGVTGGVYKARERIHRDNADSRLLAIPTSWSRVADSNPD